MVIACSLLFPPTLPSFPLSPVSLTRHLASAEGSYLAHYEYKQFKSQKKEASPITLMPLGDSETVTSAWARGKVLAEAQNMARDLYAYIDRRRCFANSWLCDTERMRLQIISLRHSL